MPIRDNIQEAVQGLIDFGVVQASAITSTVKQVVVTVLGVEDTDGNEQRSQQILYGNAAVLLRPAEPENGVGMEVVFVRSGDDMVPIAHRETRWQVDLSEGEVVVRALGEDAAKIRLKPTGEVVVESGSIKMGGDSVSDKPSLATKVDDQINTINRALDAFATAAAVTNDGGEALQTAFSVAWGATPKAPSETGSTIVEMD